MPTARRLRPLALLLLITSLPFLVAMRTRKPWVLFLEMLLGWNVLFIFINSLNEIMTLVLKVSIELKHKGHCMSRCFCRAYVSPGGQLHDRSGAAAVTGEVFLAKKGELC
jgi:hypothetical protein